MCPRRCDTHSALTAQGVYYVATGVLPFVSRRAFEAVTGPKREWWLVQTVAALVTVMGGGILSGVRRQRATPELVAVAAGSAASLAAIDVVYVLKRRIAPTYLIDAAVELGFLSGLVRARRPAHAGQSAGIGCGAGRGCGTSDA